MQGDLCDVIHNNIVAIQILNSLFLPYPICLLINSIGLKLNEGLRHG
jgi:hypothetical protein